MKINGFQKMTMLDYPGKVACTVFTAGCNMRCPFCHNARLVTHPEDTEIIPEETVFSYLEKRRGILDGVAVTGGEPLLQPDIKEFLSRVKSLGYAIKLDTNGTSPEKLEELIKDGFVDYVAMDIKNSPELYSETAGVENFAISSVEKSKKLLLSGVVPYEFRTTVAEGLHTLESLKAAAEWIKGADAYYLQCFVDSGDIIGENLSAPTAEFMKEALNTVSGFVKFAQIRGL